MAAFELASSELADEGIAVVAGSTDSHEHAAKTVDDLGLRFPVGHSLPLVETASILGAFYEERRGILHATGFITRPGGAIVALHYSAGPIGRFVVDDVLRLVRFYKSK